MADGTTGTGQNLQDTHVVMGRIGAPHGVKGWVKLISFADVSDDLLTYKHFYIRQDGTQTAAGGSSGTRQENLQKIEIDDARPQGQGFIGHIKGCDVREETRFFTGKDLLLPKTELPALEEGYYWHQLEGLRVTNLAGEYLGIIDHMLGTGANDVMVVRGNDDSIDREERLIPWVEDQVVQAVDLAAGVVRVDWERDF